MSNLSINLKIVGVSSQEFTTVLRELVRQFPWLKDCHADHDQSGDLGVTVEVLEGELPLGETTLMVRMLNAVFEAIGKVGKVVIITISEEEDQN